MTWAIRVGTMTWAIRVEMAEINAGGTPHTQDELDKVRAMLKRKA